jgi:hypothetical protein
MSKPKRLKLYCPHEMQKKIHECKVRYRVAAWGRQSGKSTCANMELLKNGWLNRNHTYWFISPTYSQSLVQYRRLVGCLWNTGIMLKKNQSELRVKLKTMSQIVFKSGDRPDNLRTETLNGVIIDEVRDQDPDLFPMVIRPMLATTKGWALFISTPNGFDYFYDLFERARLDTSGLWAHFQAPSTCNPGFTFEEVEEARKVLTEPQFAQELMAEFRDLYHGKVYVNYNQENESDIYPFAENTISPHLPIILACDFNLNPMAWTLGQQHVDEFYWHDEIWLPNSHTQEAAHALVDKVKGHRPGLIIAGDATSKAGQRAAAGRSDYDILCEILDSAGIRWQNRTPDSNPTVRDRINSVNLKLCDSRGVRHMRHHSRCERLKRDMVRVSWKEGNSSVLDQSTDPTLTHSSDGVGYAIYALSPVPSINVPGGLRLILR